ncbi:MAG: hypothetical protein ACYC5O_18045 [Anaerolineae bacterium]
MAVNQLTVEQLAAWCFNAEELATERKKAWRIYFGEDDPRPVKYWGGVGERNSRERRFLGWFMFDHVLPTGDKPAEAAAKSLYTGAMQDEVLRAVAGTRYVNAAVGGVIGRSVFLQLEDESFEVHSRVWATELGRNQAIVAHIVPVGHRRWVPAPGWFIWPVTLGPGMRESMKSFQLDPISAERFLQGRLESDGEEPRHVPDDRTFEAAVARMTDWAQQHGFPGLVLSLDEWQALVLKHLRSNKITAIVDDLVAKAGTLLSEDDLQAMLDLAMNVWNNTPQPDRDGRSANELSGRHRESAVTDRDG